MRKRLRVIATMVLWAAAAQTAVTVSNVAVEQVPGTKLVLISYDVACDITNLVAISMSVSNAAGTVNASNVSGHVGTGVPVGSGRQIVWNGGTDQNGQNLSGLRIWVDASAGVGGTAPAGMVAIPAGTNSGTAPDYGAYSLAVSAFFMDATEVTKAKWDEVYVWAVAKGYSFANAGSGKAGNHPVHTVDWYDCMKWCNARSEMDGRSPCYSVGGTVYKTGRSEPTCNFDANGYRLPTNTEWEYAARGGLSGKRFPWGDTITHSQANYYSDGALSYDISPTRGLHPTYNDGILPYTSPVGSFAANGYGLYDMAGNVWEWTNDSAGPDSLHYFRGGVFWTSAGWSNCGCSMWYFPDHCPYSSGYEGFRAVCR